jgi:lipopolysaccharide biosynthesis regulator YciM
VIAIGNLGLAESYGHTGKAEQIPMLVSTAMPYSADRSRMVYLMALSAYHTKDYKTAYSYLAKLVKNSVLMPETLYMMSSSAYELGNYRESYQIARLANLTEPGPKSQLILAKNALIEHNSKDATESLQKLIKTEPDNTEALALMALAQEQAGEKALAQSYRKDALKRDPNIFAKVKIPQAQEAPVKPEQAATAKTDKEAPAKPEQAATPAKPKSETPKTQKKTQ